MIPTLMTEKVQQALEFATKAHEGQFRKNSNLPYITHPIAVRESLYDFQFEERYDIKASEFETLEIVALLHDVMEDTSTTYEELCDLFGLKVAQAVGYLSKKSGENYLDAVLRAKSNRFARIIKILDNQHNMSDLKEGTLKDKYRLSRYILEN